MAECLVTTAPNDVDAQLEGESPQGKARPSGSAQQQRRCGGCYELGYNSRTCRKGAENTNFGSVNCL
ncbi:hypothetical protein GQ43DRAFT_133932 [Delitschia confertaspora ATCC 74209]|uniref:Uncharacterized protein n=1 Tax=Delitschia confertaspora ATCC 74209 TaxID=1513339 RepID=A0A9P4JGH5_9PLEO|nr:hypothetical protein GQ43DRAFT_133932 [Delitschia confertaspora ATCC 74209]